MKKILKRISTGILCLAIFVGTAFCFTGCGDKTSQDPPPNPPYVDPIDPTDPTPPEEDPTNPDQPEKEDPTNPEQPGDEDPTDPSQPGDDEKDEEKYFALAEIGEAIKGLYGYDVLSLYEMEDPETTDAYLCFIGKNEHKVVNMYMNINMGELRLKSLNSPENVEVAKDFVKNNLTNKVEVVELKSYSINGKYTTDNNLAKTNAYLNVLLADQTDTLGDYEILYGELSDTYGGGMDTQLGDYLNIQVNATVLNKSNGNIYNYSNVVSVMKNLSENPHDAILKPNGYEEQNEELTKIIESSLTKEYQQSVKDKAEQDASKPETTSYFALAEIGEALEECSCTVRKQATENKR